MTHIVVVVGIDDPTFTFEITDEETVAPRKNTLNLDRLFLNPLAEMQAALGRQSD